MVIAEVYWGGWVAHLDVLLVKMIVMQIELSAIICTPVGASEMHAASTATRGGDCVQGGTAC